MRFHAATGGLQRIGFVLQNVCRTGQLARERIASGRTMIIVSHRLSSLADCDQIVVMEQGRIVDCGKHEVLVERCAIYRQLWNQQNRHGEAPRPSAAPRLVSTGDSEK